MEPEGSLLYSQDPASPRPCVTFCTKQAIHGDE